MGKRDKLKINTIVVLVLGVGIVLYVILRMMFPAFTYHLNKTDKFKIQILKEQIGEKYFLAITPLYDYPYNKVMMTIKSMGKFKDIAGNISVYKGFAAEIYPEGDRIETKEQLENYLYHNNDTELPNGSLVRYNDAIFFVSRGKLRPFLGPEVFLRLNYSWNNVLENRGKTAASMEEGEKINFISSHPDGTIIKTEQNELFLIWEKHRLPIENEQIISAVWDGNYYVETGAPGESSYSCEVIKQNKNNISCVFEPHGYSDDSIGYTYLFELPGGIVQTASNSKITFDLLGRFEYWVAKESIKRIKDDLHERYSGHLFK